MHRNYFLLALSLLLLFACNNNQVVKTTDAIPVPIVGSEEPPVSSHSTTQPPLYSHSKTQQSTTATTLHALIVADTTDKTIGESVDIDRENIGQLLQSITENTGLRLSTQSIYGEQVTHRNITQALNRLSVGPNDAVIFYYSGHGINMTKGSRWPALLVGGRFMELDFVVGTLKAKKPRFFIAIADACNTLIEMNYSKRGSKSMGTLNPENYRALFLNSRGHIITSSSTPGQKSWGDKRDGGFFTQAFLNSLNEELDSSSPSWHALMKRATKSIPTPDPEQPFQQPQDEINIERIAPSLAETNGAETDIIVQTPPVITVPDVIVPPESTIAEITPVSPQNDLLGNDGNQLFIQVLPSRQFRLGEMMRVKVHNRSHKDGYILVWDINSAGQLTRIFPNQYSRKNYQIKAGKTVTIPENAYAGFGLTIVEPVGNNFVVTLLVKKEQMQTVLSQQLEDISATNAQAALQRLRQRLNQRLGQGGWAIATVDYEIVH